MTRRRIEQTANNRIASISAVGYAPSSCRSRPASHVLSESETVLRESEGFSFAQLQEAFILAGQQAFSRRTDIDENDLMYGIQMLRASNKLSSLRDTSAGFRSDATLG